MARCELTGKRPRVKNLVSHSNIKTKSLAMPNIQQKKLYSHILKGFVSLKVATSTLKAMEHVGGFDLFLLRQDPRCLSPRALKVLQRMRRKIAEKKS
ncbi:MAG: 50S ribosomal protein L28 [Bdellovibrionaceae bacterium]|nr:50S ribosomal protein L28 [Pseudobdellovibrionaceae bacterium]MDW8190478.1 50S ribosomal protein L28 [Pseudobdellovibrionaceae bacterium]